MNTQGPYDLTLNTGLPLNDPGATSNNPATAVQIQNASPFILDVNSGGDIYTIQSFTAQTLPTSGGGQQMSVTPIQSGGNAQRLAPKSLTVVWLLAGESSPMVDGPLTAAAIQNTLGSQGIAGAQLMTSVIAPASSGVASAFSLSDGSYRLWNWGFNPTVLMSPTLPTKGYATCFINNSPSTADDSMHYTQGGSNRLAGLLFVVKAASSFGPSFFNFMDADVDAFLTYSAA